MPSISQNMPLDTRACRTECSADGSGAVFSLHKPQAECKDNDPCLWFTSMPSQDLRRARSLFVDAVKFAVAAANSSKGKKKVRVLPAAKGGKELGSLRSIPCQGAQKTFPPLQILFLFPVLKQSQNSVLKSFDRNFTLLWPKSFCSLRKCPYDG